ncbi:MAG: hypothetical protein WCX69_06095, partial [Candidatus Paceibacterota bacterium]
APKEGSFIIDLNLVASVALILFQNSNYIADLITIIGDLYRFKQWISKNGKPETIKPKEDQTVEIRNTNGNITIDQRVYNIYQESPRVRANLRNTFSKLKEQEEITDFSIKDIEADKEIFRAERDEFSSMASSSDEVEQKKQKLIKENQELSVFKVVFQENFKWEFFYQGNRIYATMRDQVFFGKIERGEVAFRSGDRLTVNLEIDQIFNEAANTFVNDCYHITKVIEHIPRSPQIQSTMDFDKSKPDNC